jgi:hypothetical protein
VASVTTFLRSDHPAGWRVWVDFVSNESVVNAVAALSLTDTVDGFAAVNGQLFFDFIRHDDALWTTFDDVENGRRATPRHDLGVRAALLIAALTNAGTERTRPQLKHLGIVSGLHLVRTTRLGSGDLTFEYRVAGLS